MFSGQITGRLARDAESRTTASGLTVATFTVPNDTGYGERKKTDWVKVTVFGKSAEFAGRLVKGDIVACSGQVCTDEWTNKDGIAKTTLCLTADKIDKIGSSSSSAPPRSPTNDPGSEDVPF